MSASIVNSTLQNAMYIAINLQDILYGVSLGAHGCSSAMALTHSIRVDCQAPNLFCISRPYVPP